MLDPDLIIGKLIGKTFVSKLYLFDEIDSTNDFAKKNSLPDNSLIITNFQHKGRGRFERQWESEKGKNLTFSIFKKFELQPDNQINLNYCVGYALLNELKNYLKPFLGKATKLNLLIKWPNDIILNNKKIAGILIETKHGTKEFIIGVGVNVNQESFSTDFATSLFNELKRPANLNNLLINIFLSLDSHFKLLNDGKYMELYGLWKENAGFIWEKISYLTANGEKREGIVMDILPNGQILINEGGKNMTYRSGEIKLQF